MHRKSHETTKHRRSLPSMFRAMVLPGLLVFLSLPFPAIASPSILPVPPDDFDRLVRDGSADLTVIAFMAAWCGPCRVELPHLVRLHRKYRDRGLRLVGLGLDERPETLAPLLAQTQVDFPVYWAGNTPVERYGIQGIPLLFFIQGHRIVDRMVGLHPFAELETRVRELLPDVPEEILDDAQPPEASEPPPGVFSP